MMDLRAEGSFTACRIILAAALWVEKIRPAQIGRDHLVKAFFPGVEHIGPDARSDARVVDQNIEPAKLAFHSL